MLLAAASETMLITQLCEALPTECTLARPPLTGSSATLRQRLLLTLLFLGAVGLQRTWDLRGYTADGLALLTGRPRAYGYRFTEAFLSQVAHSDGAERLTEALARWTTQLWHAQDEMSEQPGSLTCYIDGHRKPVYTDTRIPRGLVGRLSTILGCRALVLLHDEQGHPLLVTTYRGDQHLTIGLPLLIAQYEQSVETARVSWIIVDREGMATEFLASLHEASRSVVTILRTDQYQDLASFSQLGEFVPLLTDFQGQIVREVAPASITLPRPDHPGEVLSLRQRLAPFFRLPGRVIREPATVQVELRPFNDRQLNRDLAEVCARVNQRQPALPDGRRLVLSVGGPIPWDQRHIDSKRAIKRDDEGPPCSNTPTFPRHGSCGTLSVRRTSEEEQHDETALERNLLSLSGRV